VTSAASFPELFPILRDRIDAGHMAGLDWFTTDRAAASCDPKTLMAEPLSILSVGIAYWGSDDGKPDDEVPRGRISRYARGRDYHEILSERMRALHASIEDWSATRSRLGS
jgi:epoxyqueuosine reductase